MNTYAFNRPTNGLYSTSYAVIGRNGDREVLVATYAKKTVRGLLSAISAKGPSIVSLTGVSEIGKMPTSKRLYAQVGDWAFFFATHREMNGVTVELLGAN